jgi:hypothetical protein
MTQGQTYLLLEVFFSVCGLKLLVLLEVFFKRQTNLLLEAFFNHSASTKFRESVGESVRATAPLFSIRQDRVPGLSFRKKGFSLPCRSV